MRVSISVCGRFHYFNYVPAVSRHGILQAFHYSHRLNSKGALADAAAVSHNFWPKEYLYQLHLRSLGSHGLAQFSRIYHGIWQWQLNRCIQPVDLFHFLLHGNCSHAATRAKRGGAFILADAVNSHPRLYFSLIEQEHAALGLPVPADHRRQISRLEEEVSLSDGILTPSSFVRDSFLQRGYPKERIHSICYGANLEHFSPLRESAARCKTRGLRAICVAQVTPRKGHHYLLQAWKELNLLGARLDCYGMVDADVARVLKNIRAPNVFFHGSVDKATLLKALQNSDVFVLPSVEEGMAVSILEAMACGLPVIATENSGAVDVVNQGREGFVVPIQSSHAIAEKLAYIAENREVVVEMGLAARRAVEQSFRWDTYASNLIEHYRHCLSMSR
jgi:glycosyltransferase involved in cell wall biosynthesis